MNEFQALQGQQKRDFEITVAQALNLAVEWLSTRTESGEALSDNFENSAKHFFSLLLKLKADPILQNLYVEKLNQSPPEESGPKPL